MVLKLLLILLIGYNAYNINSLRVYENSAKLFDKSTETISPHLHLNYNENEGNVKWEKGMTICLRFNFKRIPHKFLWIGDTIYGFFRGIKFVYEGLKYRVQYANYNTSFRMTWSINEIEKFLSINSWHHLCIGISHSELKAFFVLVSQDKCIHSNHPEYSNCYMSSM